MLRIAPLKQLLSHFRFLLTLRSEEGKYHSLILFRLAPDVRTELNLKGSSSPILNAVNQQLYAMEATCPHLGAEMSHADIEELEDSVVAVCPWHR